MTTTPASRELEAWTSSLRTVAVTGTNGKTSTTSMLAAISTAAGELAVRVTTLGMWVGEEQTADDGSMASFDRTLQLARRRGARTLAVEVTSRALEGGFAARVPAHVAALTNFTRDHLDRHGTPERYLAAKAQLFLHLRPGGTAVFNAADPASALLREIVPAGRRCISFAGVSTASLAGAELPVALAAMRVETSELGTRIELGHSPLAQRLGGLLQLRLLGRFQADNALCAAVAADAAGFDARAIRDGLAVFPGVPGRFEPCAHEPLVLVDFAHTPDALVRVLESARELANARAGRLGCVFGCGGQRDRDKRPQMGAIAARLADEVWLTTDNPRSEPPDVIAAMILTGARASCTPLSATWHVEPDRRAAIDAAVHWATAADVVVIAGRGHETHQLLSTGPVAFSDREAVRQAIGRIR